jgi:hypothetical protein
MKLYDTALLLLFIAISTFRVVMKKLTDRFKFSLNRKEKKKYTQIMNFLDRGAHVIDISFQLESKFSLRFTVITLRLMKLFLINSVDITDTELILS